MKNEKRIIEASKDGFVFKTSDASEVLEFLSEREKHVKVSVVDTLSTIPVFPVDTRIDPEEFRKHNVSCNTMECDIGYSPEEAFEECCRNVGLIVTTTKGYDSLLLRDTAEAGLHDACEVKGSGWNNVRKNSAVHSDACNAFLSTNHRRTTLIEVYGRVTGIASSKYTYLPQDQLLQAFITAGAEGNGSLGEFIYTHGITYAYIDFPAEEARKYSLDLLGFDKSKTTLRMYMCTSDCRQSSAHVWFILTDGEKACSAVGAYQAHKGRSAIARFSESCMTMFEALNQSCQELQALEGITLQYPESTIRDVARRLGIADRHTVSVIRDAKKQGIDMNGWTAYEGYLFLCGVIDSYQPKKKAKTSARGSLDLFNNYVKTEQKAKIAHHPWKEIDAEERYEPVELLPEKGKADALPGQMSFDDIDAVAM